AALDAFPGTVLLVSHDRALLDAIAERTLAIEERTLRAYDGGWAELLRAREEREARARPPEPAAAPPKSSKPKATPKSNSRRPSALERIEAEIATREAEVADLEKKLAENWSDVDVLAAHKRSRDALTALLERW